MGSISMSGRVRPLPGARIESSGSCVPATTTGVAPRPAARSRARLRLTSAIPAAVLRSGARFDRSQPLGAFMMTGPVVAQLGHQPVAEVQNRAAADQDAG